MKFFQKRRYKKFIKMMEKMDTNIYESVNTMCNTMMLSLEPLFEAFSILLSNILPIIEEDAD